MLKTILPFYIICFALYIFFTRQPDYIDGQFTTGTIHFLRDNKGKQSPKVSFKIDDKLYRVNASYVLRTVKENEVVPVIYDTSNPENASVYMWWGYWLRWDELLASILIPFGLFYGAKLITNHPAPDKK